MKPLPCPVCGKAPRLDVYRIGGEDVSVVVSCTARGKTSGHQLEVNALRPLTAIKRWNRMVERKAVSKKRGHP